MHAPAPPLSRGPSEQGARPASTRARGVSAAALGLLAALAGPAAALAQARTEPGTRADAPPPAETAPGAETEAGGDEATTATASVVVDERQAELEREQRAMREEAAAEERAPSGDDGDDTLSHLYQLGLRVGAGAPFFFGIRYGDGPPCDNSYLDGDPDSFCVFGGSGFVDLELSFGVTEDLEITAMGRYGFVGTEPTEENQLLFGLGIRSLLMPRDVLKLFLGARVLVDVTPEGVLEGRPEDFDWGPVDLGVRGEFGVQVDLVRYFGLYAQIGINVLFLRALGVWGDLTGGLQVRLP